MSCPTCNDRGFVWVAQENPKLPPVVETCHCQTVKELIANVNRGWQNLIHAPKVQQSPLYGMEEQNVWVSATYETFRSHMRYVALRQGFSWNFRVVSDSDLITAWLGSTALKRSEIFDADIAMSGASISSQMHSLVDLVEPPELLVIQLGVKSARNSAMPEVFLETLKHRTFQNKPTWVFDQPDNPFNYNHLCFSEASLATMNEFKRVTLQRGESLTPRNHSVTLAPHTPRTPTPVEDILHIPIPRESTKPPVDTHSSGAVYEIKAAGQKKPKRRT